MALSQVEPNSQMETNPSCGACQQGGTVARGGYNPGGDWRDPDTLGTILNTLRGAGDSGESQYKGPPPEHQSKYVLKGITEGQSLIEELTDSNMECVFCDSKRDSALGPSMST